MTDHDLLITVATKLEGIEGTLTGEGGVCEQLQGHDEEIMTMKTYWKVTIGMLVVIIPTVAGIILWVIV